MSLLDMVRAQDGQGPSSEGREATEGRARQAALRSRLKEALVERLGLDVVARIATGRDVERSRAELAVTCRAILNSGGYEDVADDERAALVRQALDDVCGLGPLQGLLEDDAITEVVVNGTHGLFFERDGKLYTAPLVFDSDEQILTVVDKILAPLGRRLDQASPIVNARLANGDRVNAVAPPVAVDGPAITIRKFSNRITSLDELTALGSLPTWYARLLSWAVALRKDIAVAGGTGSGKTTLLNALSCEIGLEERIVTIEDSAELRFRSHPDVVRLEARAASIEGTGAVSIRDLVKNSLRMRPDRIIVGECRSEETIDMLQAMNTGHDGSMTTLHAGTPHEAILRLVLMARFGMDLPTDVIEAQIATALDLLVMSHRLYDGTRCIGSLSEVSPSDGGGVRLATCVTFDSAQRSWHLEHLPAFVDAALTAGALSRGEVDAWKSSVS